jgi:hypothetical protein
MNGDICLGIVGLLAGLVSYAGIVWGGYLLGKRTDKGVVGLLLGLFLGGIGLLIMCFISGGTGSSEEKPSPSGNLIPVRKCDSCSRGAPANSKFCPHCGEQLDPLPSHATSLNTAISVSWDRLSTHNLRCPNCHSPSPPQSRFCIYCRHQFSG